MSAYTRLPFDRRPPSVPDEPLAVLVFGHEVAPCTQTDNSRHGAIINIGRTCWQVAATRTLTAKGLVIALPQQADEQCPMRPVLLAVDQELGEGATLRVSLELSNSVGPLEVGEHEDVEKLGAGSQSESIEAFPESALELIRSHRPRLRRPIAAPHIPDVGR